MNEPNIINRIYRKSAKLNLYFAMGNPKIERVYKELSDIEKDVKEAINVVSKYIKN